MGDQLWGFLIAGLGEMHLVARPEGRSFLGIARVRGSYGELISSSPQAGRALPPLASLVERLKLLLPDEAQGRDSGQGVHPVWSGGSLERLSNLQPSTPT